MLLNGLFIFLNIFSFGRNIYAYQEIVPQNKHFFALSESP